MNHLPLYSVEADARRGGPPPRRESAVSPFSTGGVSSGPCACPCLRRRHDPFLCPGRTKRRVYQPVHCCVGFRARSRWDHVPAPTAPGWPIAQSYKQQILFSSLSLLPDLCACFGSASISRSLVPTIKFASQSGAFTVSSVPIG